MALLSNFLGGSQWYLIVGETRSVHHYSECILLRGRIDKLGQMDCTLYRRVLLDFLAQASPICEPSLLLPFGRPSGASSDSLDRDRRRHRDEYCSNGRRGAVFLHPKNCHIPTSPLAIDSSLQLVEPGELSSRPQARPPITVRKAV